MENKKQKCSLKEHNEFDANSYCQKCEIYMCHKCEKNHLGLCPNHQTIILDKDISEIFTGFCKLENHQNKLEYYCKIHNVLCCSSCIAKIKTKGNGQHTDCDVCYFEDIFDEKKQNLKNNIKILEDLSNTLQSSINELKVIVEEYTKNKDEIKINIQKIFTQIRNTLNKREDELLFKVDTLYENFYFNEERLKETIKLPNKVKISLEKGKSVDKEMDNNNKLISLINDCINIENDIKHITTINTKIKECSSMNPKIKFNSDDNGTSLIESIGSFGSIDKEGQNIFNQNYISLNVPKYNPQNIQCVKKLRDNCGYGGNSFIYDSLCFFISKQNESVIGYIDSNYCKSVIFFDIINDKELKRINNAHENFVHSVKYYPYHLYDIILTTSNKSDIKIWNYNECLNILTINNIFNSNYGVYSSALLFNNNSFYIFCIGDSDYIKVYNSSGKFYKNIGSNEESRRYIEIFEINENKYIVSGGNKGVNVFNYPSLSTYHCFIENNDSNYHNYIKIIKIKDIYNLIDVGSSRKIKIWDFFNKSLIKCIDSNSILGGFIVINNVYLIIGSKGEEILEFDINNGTIQNRIKKHSSFVIGIKPVKYKDEKQYFISYGHDSNIYLWSLN